MDLFTIVMLALIDSVDPCIFAIYVGILASMSSIGIGALVRVAVSFIVGVFIGYLSFGLFLKSVLAELPIDRRLLALLLLLYGLLVLYSSLPAALRVREARMECRQEDLPCRVAIALGLYGASPRGALVAALLGFVAAITLLPCTSGMYIVYNVLMREVSLWVWALYTIVYNVVFVSPLVVISAAFIFTASVPSVSFFLLSRAEQIKVIGGFIAVLVAIYILWTYYST
ncbi:MAG: hypothetical protein N3F67_04085 [Acidilobaceae archaeon]|nr:hypothetical protein [Acidilobaceae archaeon]